MSEPVLSVRGLTKRFGGVHALQDVSFDLRAGEILALAGDNGAGKSTLVKTVCGVYQPNAGEIFFQGQHVAFPNPRAARDAGIETIHQDLALADNLDVAANVFLGREPMRRMFGIIPRIDRRRMAEGARKAIGTLDIAIPRLDVPVRALSGGQRQAVAIGRAVMWNAALLIMDEPTAALGVPEQRKVVALIRSLKAAGKAVIFISHNLSDIFAVSDRILVLRRGRKAGERAVAETNGEEVVRLMVGSA
jgi:ABC-type sugar transport system ATPase subunit